MKRLPVMALSLIFVWAAFSGSGLGEGAPHTGTEKAPQERPQLPGPGEVCADLERGEVLVQAVVQHPKGKPCIDDWGQRGQAFAGCRRAAGGASKCPEYFVFLSDAKVEDIHDALLRIGGTPRVHYAIDEAKRRSGLKPSTTSADFLQGDPVLLSVSWQEGDVWRERPYQDFVQEKVVLAEGGEVVKPWTPHFVFHGSGALHASGTGCIACPCDCPGGIIADNRNPVVEPRPVLKFDWSKAPPEGTTVYVRIRLIPVR